MPSDTVSDAAALAGELLGCPFCGAPAKMTRFVSRPSPVQAIEITQIQCDNDDRCQMTVDIQHINEAVAIKAWNTRTPIPVAVSRAGPLDFFSENVDAWGALEWFNRLATAIRQQDAAVLAKDDVALEICRNVAASSAMRFVRDYEQQVRAALSLPAVAVSRADELRKTLLWLRNHYDVNNRAVKSSVLKRVDAVLDDCGARK